MKPTRHRLPLVLLLASLAVPYIFSCAHQGYPTGGPKDETPPKVLGTTPANGTINFNSKEFLISFDEYVQVQRADENILVSPPMKQKPEYSTKGRGILVKLKDTLRENTTYLFQFKGAIVDYNEGNALESFEYVFSTGDAIDSMTIRGEVLDAFTLKPCQEAVTVVAYLKEGTADTATGFPLTADSLVANEQPTYMTRCDKEGHFELNHLRAGRYLLIAYEDGDKNLRLGNDEAMAFLDSLITAQKMPPPPVAKTDSTSASDSSNVADSLAAHDTIPPLPDSNASFQPIEPVTLLVSLSKKETQHVVNSQFTSHAHIEIITQCPLTDSFSITQLYGTPEELFCKLNRARDTLQIWTARQQCDSITLLLHDTNLHDTLKLQYREKRNSRPAPSHATPSIMRSLVTGTHPYFDTLWVAFDTPVKDTSCGAIDSAVRVFNLTDSSISYCSMTLAHDLTSSGSSRAMINFSGKSGEKYRFSILPNRFTNIHGTSNTDTLQINTEFTKAENYGNIILDVTIAEAADTVPLIIQLTNEKGDVLRKQTVTQSGRITFSNLKGGKYNIRAIFDTDGNQQWTPGDYWTMRQPERVLYFEKTLELRENWDMEEKWTL